MPRDGPAEPAHRRLEGLACGIEIDEQQAGALGDVDFPQGVLRTIEVRECLGVRGVPQRTVKAVEPRVIGTGDADLE